MSISISQSPFNYSLPFLRLAAPRSRESWGEVVVGYKLGKPSFWEGFNGFHLVYFCFLSKCTLRTQGEQLNSQSSAWCESLLKLPLSLCPLDVLPSLCSARLLSCENQRSSHRQRNQGPEQVLVLAVGRSRSRWICPLSSGICLILTLAACLSPAPCPPGGRLQGPFSMDDSQSIHRCQMSAVLILRS